MKIAIQDVAPILRKSVKADIRYKYTVFVPKQHAMNSMIYDLYGRGRSFHPPAGYNPEKRALAELVGLRVVLPVVKGEVIPVLN
jgi:hypothetical protein